MTQKQFLDKWLPEDASPEAEDTFRAELAMVAKPASFLTQETINAAAEQKHPLDIIYYSDGTTADPNRNERAAFLAGAAFAQDGGMRWVEVRSVDDLPDLIDYYYCKWYYKGDYPKSNMGVRHLSDMAWMYNFEQTKSFFYISESPNINQGGENTL